MDIPPFGAPLTGERKTTDPATPSFIEALTDISKGLGNVSGHIHTTVIPSVILGGAAPLRVLATNLGARTRSLINTGVASCWFGFGSTVNELNGVILQPGGGFDWPLGAVDPRALYVFSLEDTAICAIEGS